MTFAPIKWEMDDTRDWDSQKIPKHAAYTMVINSTESSMRTN